MAKDTLTVTLQQTTKLPPQKGKDGTPYPDVIETVIISGECANSEEAVNELYMELGDKIFRAKIHKSKVIKGKRSSNPPAGKSIGLDNW